MNIQTEFGELFEFRNDRVSTVASGAQDTQQLGSLYGANSTQEGESGEVGRHLPWLIGNPGGRSRVYSSHICPAPSCLHNFFSRPLPESLRRLSILQHLPSRLVMTQSP